MFKVLIIDDEPIIRKGLKNIINWKQFECEVCGEASDGFEGCCRIKDLLPDIIITDIRMPEVDGLSMIREIKELVPGSKIIMLTGFRNFDYVQEALKLGAFDFILKPTRIEELTSVISRAVKELRFQKDRAEEINKIRRLFEQNIPILREKLLYDVIHEINSNDEDIAAKMELFGISIHRFTMVVVENEYLDSADEKVTQYDRHLYQFGIINTFEEVFTDAFSVTSIALNENSVAFVVQPLDSGTDIYEAINKKCVYLQDIIRNCFGFTATIAVSSAGEGVMQLPARHRECVEALEHKFYIGENAIIFHNDLNTFFKYEEYSILEKYQKSLLEGVKAGNEASVRARLHDIFGFIKAHEPVNRDYLRNFYQSAITSINNIRRLITAADSDKEGQGDRSPGCML